MPSAKADIIAQLRRDLLPLQGLKPKLSNPSLNFGLGPMKFAFPNATFPVGAVHELVSYSQEGAAATNGFMAGLLSLLMKQHGVILWIGAAGTLYPPALKTFGIEADKVIFVQARQDKELLWAMEEALRCEGLAAVVGEVGALSFKASRRLQLAVENSNVTGFVVLRNPRHMSTTACVTRWVIEPLPSLQDDEMPGVGFPRWKVSLMKVRNGKPGVWEMEWVAGRFRHLHVKPVISRQPQKQTG
ncbi:Error-prone repair protein ImuA [Chitinophaga horti]|uniref:Error-prone repair protein ImuA n=1 Tax=Chitinophaga horti TaxID=2920382 RepID=A0ABY6IUX9_9BACT|nr:Error-prone repair protein ImuA [Chitinophaga horti]UYQ91174.1 Error-prone repair protein ImuA [Chitinophaga horti]